MWPDRVSNPGSLTYESGALPTALRGAAPVLILSTHERVSVKSFSKSKQKIKLCANVKLRTE